MAEHRSEEGPSGPIHDRRTACKTDQHDAMVHALRHTPWALVIPWIPFILDHPGAWIQRLLPWLSYTGLYGIKRGGAIARQVIGLQLATTLLFGLATTATTWLYGLATTATTLLYGLATTATTFRYHIAT